MLLLFVCVFRCIYVSADAPGDVLSFLSTDAAAYLFKLFPLFSPYCPSFFIFFFQVFEKKYNGDANYYENTSTVGFADACASE